MTSEEFLKLYIDNDSDPEDDMIKCVDNGDWIDDGKYSYKKTVYRVCYDTGEWTRYFCISEGRSGSYFSDYYYNDPNCTEVFPQQVTTTIYVTKKS
jgi:hypothetical protein